MFWRFAITSPWIVTAPQWVPARTRTVHWVPVARQRDDFRRMQNKNVQALSRLSLHKQEQSYCHLEIIHMERIYKVPSVGSETSKKDTDGPG